MNIKTRLDILEAAKAQTKQTVKISRFLVNPGNLDPIGYRCGDVTVMREPGETTKALMSRCSEAVKAIDRAIFKPL